ncbi:MAG TPA: glycosyltransferase, partial [Novosphingobium sp.]|nr:glycosyltransferase [Novosphingobium sp.]
GYDTLSTERVRRLAGLDADFAAPAFATRDFVYVGRFIPKKGLTSLISAFARFCEIEPESKRKLIMIGTGPLDRELREQVSALGLGERVEFTGFIEGSALYRRMAQALALVFVSYREQWGLVLNEATALGLPLIVSEAPGAGDILARNLVNGFVLENASIEGIARAMQDISNDEDQWHRMSAASAELASHGDCALFADAIELTIDERAQPARQRIAGYVARFPTLQHRPLVD